MGLAAAFEAQGGEAVPVPWGSVLAPGDFDLALIRTPWDYFLRPVEFLRWVEGLTIPVLNPPRVLRWNHDKRYLLELAELGAASIPPTVLLESGDRSVDSAALLEELGGERAVVKPTVSGGAHGTRVISAAAPLVWGEGDEGTFLAQPFVDAVTERGEWSLIYFGGVYSHSVLKKPKGGDFRVQDDFGGAVHFESPSAALVAAAEKVLGGVGQAVGLERPLAYARVDLVEELGTGRALLMEVELIEPELFLRADAGAPGRLVSAALAGLGAVE